MDLDIVNTAVTNATSKIDLEVLTMNKISDTYFQYDVKAKVITLTDMQNDYDFEMANIITRSMYKNVLFQKRNVPNPKT